MGKQFDQIDADIQRWMERQKVFFVATAPLSGDGLVNCSPKGGDTLRVLGTRQLAYLDYGGSGIETVAHIKENGRMLLMMCAFDGPPKIMRFHGLGEVLEPGHEEFSSLLAGFPPAPACRNIVRLHVTRIADSCGYGVPLYEYRGERNSMQNWIDQHSEAEILQYRAENNRSSLDGLPGLDLGDGEAG